jgi:hypothetical protein
VDYTLSALVFHEGTPSGGHYVVAGMCSLCAATAKNSDSDVAAIKSFRILDDRYVSGPMTREDCMNMMKQSHPTATPYLIFYTKQLEAHVECTVCKDNGARLLELARSVLPSAPVPPPCEGCKFS